MFTLQNWKVKLAYAAFGCLFGSICTIMGMLASPVTAQWDKFDIVECTTLRVVDQDGNAGVILSAGKGGGALDVYGDDMRTITISGFSDYDEQSEYGGGGYLIVQGKGQWTRLDGGRVLVGGKDKQSLYSRQAELSLSEHGGSIGIWGKGNCLVKLSGDEHGNGKITTRERDGDRQ